MAASFRDLAIFAGILTAVAAISGCTGVNVGGVVFTGENLTVSIENTGIPADAFVQVTASRLSAFSQEEYLYIAESVHLESGTNRIVVPAKLPPGSYKLYIYVIQNGERKSAVIRDIRV